ncbi:ribonuclease H-like domain-containing protein [Ganoderma leucocontextum]|nr:ribonuclease H-like domain-containing protein [Ganoderma leucocontextum]
MSSSSQRHPTEWLFSPSPHRVVFRASLTDQLAIFPAGWGLLYWQAPSRGTSAAEGEVRYRIIASVASEPRAWNTKKIRAQFAQSTDFCTEDGKPWSAGLFASVMRQMAYSEELVSRQAMADTLSDHFAEKYMEKRRVQAMTDPALAFLDKLPTLNRHSILPNLDQFAIPDDPEVAIRAWAEDTAPSRVYSDGALHKEGWMGAGVVLQHISKRGRPSRRRTRRVHLGRIPPFPYNVHDAEIVGLGEALSLAAEEQTLTRLSVYTDSRLAVNAVRSSAERPGQWRLADLVLHRYDSLMRRHPNVEVIFRWIPGHKGIEGNEIADSLASKASMPPRTPR